MIKYYCNVCGEEITKENVRPADLTGEVTSKAGVPKRRLAVRLMEIDPCGDRESCVCKYCMLDAIAQADDRPKPG